MPLSARKEKILKTYYYELGYTYGRDALYYVLRKKYQAKSCPTKEEISEWMGNQKLVQLYKQTRGGGVSNSFQATAPFQNLSMDLIDWVNKPAKNYGYVLIVIDNFSRYMFTRPLTNKTPPVVAKAFAEIIADINKQFGKPKIVSVNCDDGGEFKGVMMPLLKGLGIRKIRTLGGHPEQNGLAERSVGKVKMVISKLKDIKGGSWLDHLKRGTELHNEQWNRGTGHSPVEAVLFTDKKRQSALRKHIKDAYQPKQNENFVPKREFEVGNKVRIKKNKGKLDKQSSPNWSADLYTIAHIIPSRGTMAEKYQIKEKDADLRYSRNDLQKVTQTPDPIPERKKKPSTRQQVIVDELTTGAFTRSKEQAAKAVATRSTGAKYALRNHVKGIGEKKAKTAVANKKKGKKDAEGNPIYDVEYIVGQRFHDGKLQYKVGYKGYEKKYWSDASTLMLTLSQADIDQLIQVGVTKRSKSSKQVAKILAEKDGKYKVRYKEATKAQWVTYEDLTYMLPNDQLARLVLALV